MQANEEEIRKKTETILDAYISFGQNVSLHDYLSLRQEAILELKDGLLAHMGRTVNEIPALKDEKHSVKEVKSKTPKSTVQALTVSTGKSVQNKDSGSDSAFKLLQSMKDDWN